MRLPFSIRAALVSIAALTLASEAAAVTVDLSSTKDNTLIETPVGNSNGAGDGIYIGRVGTNGGNTRRRGVVAFDLSSIPAGSTINSAALTLQMVQSNDVTSRIVSVFRLNANWGEAGSSGSGSGGIADIGDATWLYRFYNTQTWGTAGGDFDPMASASLLVANEGTYQWTGPDLAADVQSWVVNPATNFGWLLKDNEATPFTARKYSSREGVTPPRLTVDYTPPVSGVGANGGAGGVVFTQPWPAPARASVNLAYTLPREGRVTLVIHDALGRLVRRLVSERAQPAGRYSTTWDGRTDAGAHAASGVYLATLVVDHEVHLQRIPLLR